MIEQGIQPVVCFRSYHLLSHTPTYKMSRTYRTLSSSAVRLSCADRPLRPYPIIAPAAGARANHTGIDEDPLLGACPEPAEGSQPFDWFAFVGRTMRSVGEDVKPKTGCVHAQSGGIQADFGALF